MEFTALLDAPAEATRRYQIAKLGEFKDSRYGQFKIDENEVEQWRANLEKLPGGKVLIDFDHKSLRTPRDSKAAGWIHGVDIEGDRVMADIDWTPSGETAIANGEYQFFSPVFGDYTDETETTHGSTLSAGALTNVPFLSMPALVLASDATKAHAMKLLEADDYVRMLDVNQAYRDQAVKEGKALPDGSYPIKNKRDLKNAATLAASGHGKVGAAKALIRREAKRMGVDINSLPGFGQKAADSRSPMDVKVLEALGLDAEADDTKVLEAVAALKTKAEAEPTPPKALDQLATEAGKVLLDQKELDSMRGDAAAGRQASLDLAEQKFETAFQRALDQGKAVPAQKDQKHHFYTLDADAVLKELAEGPQLVNVTPQGDPIKAEQGGEVVPPGVARDGFAMDAAVKERIKELGKNPQDDYIEVWNLIQSEREAA